MRHASLLTAPKASIGPAIPSLGRLTVTDFCHQPSGPTGSGFSHCGTRWGSEEPQGRFFTRPVARDQISRPPAPACPLAWCLQNHSTPDTPPHVRQFIPTRKPPPPSRPRTNGAPGSSSNGPRTTSSRNAVQQTGFQKFLSVISFGLLGKPSSLPAVTPRSGSTSQTGGPPSASSSPRPPREPKPRRESAAPNPGEISTERLYVGNLSYDASESDLFELFNGVGGVRNAEVVVNNRTQRSKGFAFITMGSVEEARRAVTELHGKEFMAAPSSSAVPSPSAVIATSVTSSLQRLNPPLPDPA
jgi:hypothetical protein